MQEKINDATTWGRQLFLFAKYDLVLWSLVRTPEGDYVARVGRLGSSHEDGLGGDPPSAIQAAIDKLASWMSFDPANNRKKEEVAT